jgi:gluconolactonase
MNTRNLHRFVSIVACVVAVVGLVGLAAPPASAQGPGITLVNGNAVFTESPILVGEKLYYTQYTADEVTVWDGTTNKTFWRQAGCGANAVIQTMNKDFLVVCNAGNSLVRVSADGKTIKEYKQASNGDDLRYPNDFTMDAKGGIYFTGAGPFDITAPLDQSGVYYMSPDGETITLLATGFSYANGLTLIDGGKTLLIGEYLAARIVKFTVSDDATISDRAIWQLMEDISPTPENCQEIPGPDGIRTDSKGNVYIAQVGTGRVLVTDPKGKLIRTVYVPTSYVVSMAIDEAAGVLYVAAAYDAYTSPWPAAIYRIPDEEVPTQQIFNRPQPQPYLLPALKPRTDLKFVNPSMGFPEGPLWLGDKFYYVDYTGNAVMVWDGKENKVLWQEDGCADNSVTATKDGNLLAACAGTNKLVRLSPDGKVLGEITQDVDGGDLHFPNDFAVDAKGGVYFTGAGAFDLWAPMKSSAVFYLEPDMKTVKKVAEEFSMANGLTLIDGGQSLLVGEYLTARILKFKVNEDGSLSERTLWKNMQDISPTPDWAVEIPGPDGFHTDSKGNVYISQVGTGRILVTDPTGKLLGTVSMPTPYCVNVGFDKDEKNLYIPCSFDAYQMPWPGAVYVVPNVVEPAPGM